MDNGLIFPYHPDALRATGERGELGLRTIRNVRLSPRGCPWQIRDTKPPEVMTSLLIGEVADCPTEKSP